MTKARKQTIYLAALTLVCYDRGYKTIIGSSQVETWIENVEKSTIFNGADNVLRSKYKGKTSYIESITRDHPTYLHCLFRQATLTLGDAASFDELALHINQQSTVQQGQPTLQLDKYKLWRWFKANKGKLRQRITRSCLTEAHKQ